MSEREYMDSCACSYEEYKERLAETQKHLEAQPTQKPELTPEQNFAEASRLFKEASKTFRSIRWF